MEQYKYRIGFLIIIITTLLAVILTAFLGRETNVSHNELYIPLKKIYSGKTVKLVIDVQDSVYTRRISDALVQVFLIFQQIFLHQA